MQFESEVRIADVVALNVNASPQKSTTRMPLLAQESTNFLYFFIFWVVNNTEEVQNYYQQVAAAAGC